MPRQKGTSGLEANGISQYVHCGLCLREIPVGKSPQEYAALEIGFTRYGLQIWCKRHDCNVMHIDFEGKKHPAECSRLSHQT